MVTSSSGVGLRPGSAGGSGSAMLPVHGPAAQSRTIATRSLHALACRGVTSPYVSEFQDPFTCQDPFLVADRRMVSPNEGRRLQRRGSHMCAFPRGKKEMDQPSGSAGTPAATAHWDDSERTRSLAGSCSRARSSAASLAPSAVGATGIANGQAVELDLLLQGEYILGIGRAEHQRHQDVHRACLGPHFHV